MDNYKNRIKETFTNEVPDVLTKIKASSDFQIPTKKNGFSLKNILSRRLTMTLTSVFVLVLLLTVVISGSNNLIASTVILDVNPSIEISLNRRDIVVKIVAMNDDGIDSDGAAGDGVFTGILPHVPAGGYVRYYIEAVADNGQKSVTYMPEGAEYDVFIYQVNVAETPVSDLVLNEFLASNKGTIGDENGEFDDWIEIHNLSDEPISLLGYHISDDSGEPAKWTFPDVSVQPSGYLTIWADNDPEQGKLHCNFKLSADGEEIILSDGGGRIVDQFIYGSQESDVSFGRWPNGTGNFRSMIPTYNISNQVIVSEITEDQEEQFQIYPNPASEFIQIDIRGEEPLEVVIYNSIGQKVFTERFKSRLDISKLYPGIYVLRAGRYVSMFQVQ